MNQVSIMMNFILFHPINEDTASSQPKADQDNTSELTISYPDAEVIADKNVRNRTVCQIRSSNLNHLSTILIILQLVHLINGQFQISEQNDQMTQFESQRNQPQLSSRLEPLLTTHIVEGPGVDLVAFNRRRFELDHHHEDPSTSDTEVKRGQSIESDIGQLSNRLIEALPGDVSKQFLEQINGDSSLVTGITSATMIQSQIDRVTDDPDGASIARLTKNCLSVHASSAKPEQLDVRFHLYTKHNPKTPHIISTLVTRHELLLESPFDPTKPIKWITHGFHTNVDKSEWMIEAKDKILQFEDANVILTDWRRGASPALAFYPKAAANAHIVAKFIVRILRRMKDDIDLTKVHLIGHSLGAHIMGFVGSAFTEEHLMRQQQTIVMSAEQSKAQQFWRNDKQSTRQLIGRITACDPALPCFGPSSSGPAKDTGGPQPGPPATYRDIEQQKMTNRDSFFIDGDWNPSMWTHLRPDSAVIVEVMHSNPGVMGYADPLGDFDFYPNGLERQPGCGTGNVEASKTPSVSRRSARFKRQWSTLLDGVMSTVVRPIISSRDSWPHLDASHTVQRKGPSVWSQTVDKFLKPIKNFFHGHTCSHHRSVEYMVESMYYERVPHDRKLDKEFVCQMIGYRCQDYDSFKKGFCFRCDSELDCRAFGMSLSSAIMDGFSRSNQQPSHQIDDNGFESQKTTGSQSARMIKARGINLLDLATNKLKSLSRNSSLRNEHNSTILSNESLFFNVTKKLAKRVLPTFNHYNQDYQPQGRNQYFFDTRSNSRFCLYHYHIHLKYRWFRVVKDIKLDGFKLLGSLANLIRQTPAQLYKYTYNSYTILLSEPIFLGQIESVELFGLEMKAKLIEYIEITYMSNLDPKVRALGSAKLCLIDRSRSLQLESQASSSRMYEERHHSSVTYVTGNLFIRCSGQMV